MKVIKILSLLMIVTFACVGAKKISAEAVALTPQQLLKSKKWNIRGKSLDLYFEYTNNEEILHINGQMAEKSKYYISNTNCFEKSFDASKVGQTNNGKFLVTPDACYYITVVSNTVIQISYLSHENPMTTTLIAKE